MRLRFRVTYIFETIACSDIAHNSGPRSAEDTIVMPRSSVSTALGVCFMACLFWLAGLTLDAEAIGEFSLAAFIT